MKIVLTVKGEVTLNVVHIEGKFVSKDEILADIADQIDELLMGAADDVMDADLQGIGDEGLSVYEIEDSDGVWEVVLS